MAVAAVTAEHAFGGDWTEVKLRVLNAYLEAWAKVMKKHAFETHYIDAFAGTGRRTDPTSLPPRGTGQEELDLDGLAATTKATEFPGSAELALAVTPHFKHVTLSDADHEKVAELLKLAKAYAPRKVHCFQGDANDVVKMVCESWDLARDRGVLFLDPYGMQVDFTTMQTIAKTIGLDVWMLVGLDMGANRLLPADGVAEPGHRARLNRFFGTEAWEARLYPKPSVGDLFGNMKPTREPLDEVQAYYMERLRDAGFSEVASNPLVLRNRAGRPLFMLCFAVTNRDPNARQIAMRIANSLLKRGSHGTGKRH